MTTVPSTWITKASPVTTKTALELLAVLDNPIRSSVKGLYPLHKTGEIHGDAASGDVTLTVEPFEGLHRGIVIVFESSGVVGYPLRVIEVYQNPSDENQLQRRCGKVHLKVIGMKDFNLMSALYELERVVGLQITDADPQKAKRPSLWVEGFKL